MLEVIETILFLLIGGAISIMGILHNAGQETIIIGLLIILLGIAEGLISLQQYRLKKHSKSNKDT